MTPAQALAAPFAIHDLMLQAALDGFDDAMWSEPVTNNVNHPAWIVAHLNGVRRSIVHNLGGTAEERDVTPGFGDPRLDADVYGPRADLVAEFVGLGTEIGARLAEADGAALGATYEPTFPDGRDRPVGEALAFLAFHESLHIGQISLMRRLHGLGGIAEAALARMSGL